MPWSTWICFVGSRTSYHIMVYQFVRIVRIVRIERITDHKKEICYFDSGGREYRDSWSTSIWPNEHILCQLSIKRYALHASAQCTLVTLSIFITIYIANDFPVVNFPTATRPSASQLSSVHERTLSNVSRVFNVPFRMSKMQNFQFNCFHYQRKWCPIHQVPSSSSTSVIHHSLNTRPNSTGSSILVKRVPPSPLIIISEN